MTSYDDTKVQLTINRMTEECYENVPNKSSTELYLISQDPTSIAKIDLDAQSRTDAEISSIQSDLNDLSTEVSTLSEWTTTQIDDLIGDVQEVSSQTAQNAQDIADISANLTHSTVRRWEYVEYNGLTFTAEEANSTVAMQKVGAAPNVSLEYSTGDGWNDFIVGETTVTLPSIGDQMVLRAKTTNNGMGSSSSSYNKFVMTGKIASSDSIMYLLKSDGDLSAISSWSCFNNLFNGCTSLTQAPELPAITLAIWCYTGMFYNCSSLTIAPELSNTTLADYCYQNMFNGCTSLTQAPELPATSLATGCYWGMFERCTSLSKPPELPAMTLATTCYSGMFNGCTSLTQAPELPALTLASGCYQSMFYNCSSLTVAPELPATVLSQGCYLYMFYNCSSLNEIKIGYTGNFSGDGVPSGAFTNWVNGVSASGTLYYDGEDTTTGASAIPTGWTVVPIVPPIEYVDYINTNGAMFSTGVIPTTNTRIHVVVRGDDHGDAIVGCGTNDSADYRVFNGWNNGEYLTRVFFDVGGSRINTSDNSYSLYDWNVIDTANYALSATAQGGTTYTASGTTKSQVEWEELPLLLAYFDGNGKSIDISALQIYEGETLVKDYRPAKDPNGVVCFYEEVSQQYEYPTNGTWTAHSFD